MREITTIAADIRDGHGTGKARAVRRDGRIPAVVYGGKQDPVSLSVNFREIERHYLTGHFMSTLYHLDIAGKQERVVARAVQLHPVTDRPLHVDFMRLAPGARVRLMIPVHFANEEDSPGLKRGGVLNIVRHEVELWCPAETIPDFIEGDLTGLEIGDSLHISNFPLPAGVKPVIADRDFTVATLAAPSGLISAEAAAAAEEGGEEDAGEDEDKAG